MTTAAIPSPAHGPAIARVPRPAGTLSVPRATAYYVGALLGPGLLLLPGLAAQLAGPASMLAWIGLLGLSALLAWMFAVLGRRFPGGVTAYVRAGLGGRAARAGDYTFLVGAICGAPIVCLIGARYVAELTGAPTVLCAALLLLLVLAATSMGTQASSGVQLALVALLALLIVAAVVGTGGQWHASNWTPFAPHGWGAVGSAASVLMLSFVGWEATASMSDKLADPAHELPKVISSAFAITAGIYLALAGAVIAVLGPAAGSGVPLADLLTRAIGPAGKIVAAVAALALTLASTNAYLSGAGRMAAGLGRSRRWLPAATALAGVALLGAQASGVLDVHQLVAVPTTMFLTVYLLVTASATRLLRGPVRIAAAAAGVVVVVILAFCGWTLLAAAAVVLVATSPTSRRTCGIRRRIA